MSGQIQEALLEAWPLLGPVAEHGDLLVIHQHLGCHPTEVFEASNDPLEGVLGVQARGAPEVHTP